MLINIVVKTLEKLGLILDFQNSTATVKEKSFVLKRSRKGHFLASLMFNVDDKESKYVIII